MTREEAREALRRAFVATGEVPDEWAVILVEITEAALNPPPAPAPTRRRH